jgi:hypothetical protein
VPQIAGKIAGYLDSPQIEHEIAILCCYLGPRQLPDSPCYLDSYLNSTDSYQNSSLSRECTPAQHSMGCGGVLGGGGLPRGTSPRPHGALRTRFARIRRTFGVRFAQYATRRRAHTAQTSCTRGTRPDALDVPRREPDVDQTCPRRPYAQTSRRLPDACQTQPVQTRPHVPDARAQPVRGGGVWIWCVCCGCDL